jgi:hypothetical protein
MNHLAYLFFNEVTMDHIYRQLERLQSPKKNTRYDACEELRVAPRLPPEAIAALQLASNDPYTDVADAANRALLTHKPAEMYSVPIPGSWSETALDRSSLDSELAEEDTSIPAPLLPEQVLVFQMYKSINSWAVFSIFWGGLSIVASNTFDALWGIILIIEGILAWKIKVPAMFILFSVIMGWAAITNGLSAFEGHETWWLLLALFQIWWTFSIVKLFRKYRHLRMQEIIQAGTWPIQLPVPQDEVVISDRFAITGGILAGILFMLQCTFLGSFILEVLAQSEEWPRWIDLLLTGVVDVALLTFGLSLAALLTSTKKKIIALIGVVTSLLGLVAYLALWLIAILLG